MLGYVIGRLVWVALVLWLALTVTFFGLLTATEAYEKEVLARALMAPTPPCCPPPKMYILEGPPHERYLEFLGRTLRLDWGPSVTHGDEHVGDVLREDFPVTARIGLLAFALAVVLGVPLGVLAAMRRGWVDLLVSSGAALVYSFPSLVLATLLLALSFNTINVFPVGWQDDPSSILLPVLVLGLGAGAYLARVTRTAVLEVLGEDYVRTARAKGLGEGIVRRRHVLRNALPTVLAALGPTLGLLLAGSLFVEYAYVVPGTGRLLLDAFGRHDYPLILGGVTLYTVLVLGANLAADGLARLADPRIRGVRGAG